MLFALAAAMPVGTQAPADLSWMAGSWATDKWGGRMEEHWTASAGDTLVGVNRLVAEGKTPHREFLAIETKDGKTTLTVILPLRKPLAEVIYTLKEHSANRAVFVNPDHARLHTMTYWREGADLRCRIEGTRSEKPFSDDFHFKPSKIAP